MNRFKNKSPVIIFQMGKVGSRRIRDSLILSRVPNPVFHVHFLSQEGMLEAEDFHRKTSNFPIPDHLHSSRCVVDLLSKTEGKLRWKIITMVRDPIDRQISDVVDNLDILMPEARTMSDDQATEKICALLLDHYQEFDPSEDYASSWFDRELNPAFGFNIYEQSFSAEMRYDTYQAMSADILVMRYENIDGIATAAVRSFLGHVQFNLIKDNPDDDAQRLIQHQKVRQRLRLPEDLLDRIYQSRYSQFFYTPKEIVNFKSVWGQPRPIQLRNRCITGTVRSTANRILMIHPEGNVNNNPNLTGIIQILCEHGFDIDYAALKKTYPQVPPCNGVKMRLYPADGRNELDGFVVMDRTALQSGESINAFIRHRLPAYDLIIGVDRGIIEANLIAINRNVPCGLISYEILFQKETSPGMKQIEISSCRRLAFALCQDPVRSGHLIRENHLSKDIVINIPVAGRSAHAPAKSDYLHRSLNIPENKKIALVIGSLGAWTMTDYIIHCLQAWPQDWVLVIHNRYGLDSDAKRYLSRYGHLDNLLFSLKPERTHDTMKRVIQSADIGLALYRPLPNHIFVGDNIRYIGMASGKIATYLQYGLPLVVNEIGQMSDYVRNYQLGEVIDTTERYIPQYSEAHLASMRNNCHSFYVQHLDLNQTIAPLINRIDDVTAERHHHDDGDFLTSLEYN